jgi:hypothetical protein
LDLDTLMGIRVVKVEKDAALDFMELDEQGV